MIELDLIIEDDQWSAIPDLETVCETAFKAGADVKPATGLVSLLLADNDALQALNLQFRGKDKPTNVLSFPMLERGDLLDLAPEGLPEMLGDLALAAGTCAREAADKGVPLEAHAAHLLIHGLLHLAGHDHVDSDTQAEAMEALEIAALAKLGIADPYGDRN